MTLQSPFPVQSGMLMLFSLSMFLVIPSWSATKENLPKHLLKNACFNCDSSSLSTSQESKTKYEMVSNQRIDLRPLKPLSLSLCTCFAFSYLRQGNKTTNE